MYRVVSTWSAYNTSLATFNSTIGNDVVRVSSMDLRRQKFKLHKHACFCTVFSLSIFRLNWGHNNSSLKPEEATQI